MHSTLVPLLVLCALAPPRAQDALVQLPDSPAARTVASLGPEIAPAPLPLDGVLDVADPWSHLATWRLWARTLRAEREGPGAERPSFERRAILCRLARAHARDEDAWAHFATLVGSPEHAAATLPYLFPGIPANLPARAGGLAPALPAGVALRPALPPAPAGRGPLAYREAEANGLRIGEAVVDLNILVENTGVQLDLKHVSGGSTEVDVLLPEPDGFEIRIEYVDWMRQDDRHSPRRVRLEPGAEATAIFGRVLDRPLVRPSAAHGAPMPAGLLLGGLTLVVPDGLEATELELLDGLASLFGELLEVEVRVERAADTSEQATERGFDGTRIELGEDRGARERLLRYLATQIEGRWLGR